MRGDEGRGGEGRGDEGRGEGGEGRMYCLVVSGNTSVMVLLGRLQ